MNQNNSTDHLNALLAGASTWLYVVGMFLANVVTGWIALEIARSATRKERAQVEGPKTVEAHH